MKSLSFGYKLLLTGENKVKHVISALKVSTVYLQEINLTILLG